MKTETKKLTKKFWMIVLAAVCAGALFMLSGVEAKANGEIEVDSWEGLQDAIDDSAPAGTETTIKLTADIAAAQDASDAYINIGTGKKIVLDLNGHIMNRNLSVAQENGMVIKVEGELTLDDSNPTASHDGVTFDNPITGEPNTVTVTGGAITGGKNSTRYEYLEYKCLGGGVCLCPAAKFTMNAGTIVACEGNNGGGVYAEGEKRDYRGALISGPSEFVMNGGRITACVARNDRNGGGVYVMCELSWDNIGACFTLNDGVIEYCKADDGGGIYSNGRVKMNGGNIRICKAVTNGGGVCVYADAGFFLNGFIMTGGEISDCEAIQADGGGVFASNVSLSISGGEISNCKAHNYGGGVYFYGDADFTATFSGGIISECEAYDGGGVYVDDGSCILTGGTITQCTASQYRQGIYVDSDGLLLITGGNYLSSNISNEIHKQDGASFAQIKSQSISYFNNSEQPLVATQDSTNMTVYYYCSSDNATPGAIDFNEPQSTGWSEQVPKASIPGTYNVWVTVKGDENGRTAGPVKITPSPSIPKANPSIHQNPSAVQGLVCDGTAKTLVNEGTFISSSIVNNTPPTVLYAVTETNERPEDSAFAEGLPTRTEAGTYYVWYRIPESNHYKSANRYDPIEVVIEAPAEDPAQGTTTTPVVVTPVYDPEPEKEKAEAPKPSIFTRKNKDGSVTTITIKWNADGTTTVITENKQPDGSTEVKEETRDAKGNGTLKIEKKDAEGNLLSKTEGTIKVNKKGTETIMSVTENSDGSKSEKTQKTYKRDPNADNIKK